MGGAIVKKNFNTQDVKVLTGFRILNGFRTVDWRRVSDELLNLSR